MTNVLQTLFIIMKLSVLVLNIFLITLILDVIAVEKENRNEDPLSKISFDYKEKHEVPDLLTTSAGQLVDVNQLSTLNTDLLLNPLFIDLIKNTVREKIPNRFAFVKGTGAHGYFEVTNDVSKYTKAKFLEKIGKKTPIFVRFSLQDTDIASSDSALGAARGFSVKFYTEEGNFDLLGTQVPVYFYRDPSKIVPLVRTVRPNPKTQIRDINAVIDFIARNPNSLQAFLWGGSGLGLPKGYRHMNGFTNHAYELYNSSGESHFARIYFITEQGSEFLSIEEALALSSFDPDFFQRDLYNSIAVNKFPCWKLKMDILKGKDPLALNFDPFDVTRLWPNGTYETMVAGRFCLNRNVDNHYAEVEHVAMNPVNLVPGIGAPPDQLYKGRVVAYNDAQMRRLGKNYNNIEINCPMYAQTYNRDGSPPVKNNTKDSPNYYPNSFHGPEPYYDPVKPRRRWKLKEENTPDLEGCARFYDEVLKTDKDKQRLINNLIILGFRVDVVFAALKLGPLIAFISNLAARLAETYAIARTKISLANYVCEINNRTLHPYDSFLSYSPVISPVVDKVTKITGSLL